VGIEVGVGVRVGVEVGNGVHVKVNVGVGVQAACVFAIAVSIAWGEGAQAVNKIITKQMINVPRFLIIFFPFPKYVSS
jgi:hypothetical protein